MTFPDCKHAGPSNGQIRLCHSDDVSAPDGVTPADCESCPYKHRDALSPRLPGEMVRQQHNITCIHRGPVVEQRKCKPCQAAAMGTKRIDLFSCNHPETTDLVSLNNHGFRAQNGQRLTACITCEHRMEAHKEVDKTLKIAADAKHVLYTGKLVPADHMRNVFRGASVFLVGGGPSLNMMDLSPLHQRGVIVAAMNNVAASHVRPDLWFTVDDPKRFHPAIWDDPAIMKFTKRSYAQNRTPAYQNGKWTKRDIKTGNCPNTWCYEPATGWTGNYLDDPFPTWGVDKASQNPDGNRPAKSVMLRAIWMLYWLGFRRIYLLGCDFRMDKTSPYAFGETAAKAEANNYLFGWLDRRFAELRVHFQQHKLEIFNCTPNSGLAAFPSMCYYDAVADVTGPFLQPLCMEGLYGGKR